MLRSLASSTARPLARLSPSCSCSCAPSPSSSSSSSSSPSPSSSRLFSTQGLPKPASKYTLAKGLELKGTVVTTGKMQQTCTVSVERRMTDHKTLKEYSQHTKYLVHDPQLTCVVGDQVKIRNCRPVSARKRFEFVEVVKGARERVQSNLGAGAVPHEARPEAGAGAQA
ncbi:hypothetical protein DMC30DRAFT_109939 [Rhodotorula diobovata]|uniref:30S ribosomal protein S17 n=1 Tax=Rhodotorula diobovata TaxID=5288 RepID=A0A5C5G9B7_9BASI|nr:hypothetical protein DMC30DRAFT_109939 [Rhodotorula diobovata]